MKALLLIRGLDVTWVDGLRLTQPIFPTDAEREVSSCDVLPLGLNKVDHCMFVVLVSSVQS